MSDDLREETESTDNGSNRAAWFVTGAILGATIAILYAPRSGKDTRQYLSDKSRDALGDGGKNFIEAGKDMFDRGRQLVEEAADLFERGRKLVQG